MRVGQFDALDPASQCLQDDLALHARDGLAHAAMDACAEHEVAHGVAIDIEAIRFGPFAGIPVRSAQERQHLAVAIDLHAIDLDRARRRAKNGLDDRLVAQSLFEGLPRERRIGMQLGVLARVAREGQQDVGDSIDGGVDAGRKERSNQHRSLLLRDLARIGRLVDQMAESTGAQSLAFAVVHDP